MPRPAVVQSASGDGLPAADAERRRHVELILRQIDSLPTLPVVATRLLSLMANDEAPVKQVVEMISSDQALTAKVLMLCRRADLGGRREGLTVERAVVLLGFKAIRNAVLSIKVLEMFSDRTARDRSFDTNQFWRHSLAVALTAESIATKQGSSNDMNPQDAFVGGLLHDLGKLALEVVLPRSYARVVELTELNQGNIAEFERRILGIDHHTAGKRLAERWQLPYMLQDCIWLHGSAYETLPKLDHRNMIGLVSLADLVVRRHHIGYSGNFTFRKNATDLAEAMDLAPQCIESITHGLHEEMQRRCELIGLDDAPSSEMFLASIKNANDALGRLNGALDRRSRTTARQAQILDAIVRFHAGALPGRSVQDVIDRVVASAAIVLQAGAYAVLRQEEGSEAERTSWLVCSYDENGEPLRRQYLERPPSGPDLSSLGPHDSISGDVMRLLANGSEGPGPDARRFRLLPLTCGWGNAAVLVHDRAMRSPSNELQALAATWGAAIASAAQHDGAKRLGEELAEVNGALAETHDRFLERDSMARLGEMAAGAAHEMNNPLAVIYGRSQLLAQILPAGSKQQHAAEVVLAQARRLSDMITSLHLFAEPPNASRCATDVEEMLNDLIRRVWEEAVTEGTQTPTPIQLQIKGHINCVYVDPVLLGGAVRELLLNALQAPNRNQVKLIAGVDSVDRQLIIQVVDDGDGMDAHVLAHATDPFFSAKAAGRRAGMGLSRARQWAAAHGGEFVLHSETDEGTSVMLKIPLDADGTASHATEQDRGAGDSMTA